ncbi:AarF/ABC1/UbiB kinase family protein [bacterium]|nr:AarF/ABC1/UbiB kinase family protein [bacterium]MBP9808472.1 AarF/ABC1/UbiB kinase family protein [bacterium]
MTIQEKSSIDFNPSEFNPIRESFRDVSALRLLISTIKVFHRIAKLQGWRAAYRVVPIVWTIIWSVKGFSKFHAEEFERALQGDVVDDIEEAALSNQDYEEYRELGRWLCRRLNGLGPTFVKIGQTLSTRADLLPLPAMLELTKLQENVDQFPTEIARATILRELGGHPEDLYKEFDNIPIAAASLSQAYKAKLEDGRDVVVKVQRPNLSSIIVMDVQILAAVADEVMKYPSLCRHTDWPGIVDEFAKTIFEEIDYIREGRNADVFRSSYRNFDQIYIPRIVWKLTGRRVLTIEYVAGIPINDAAGIAAMGLDAEEITKTGANFYLRQLLEEGFFHADPHPGNMRIMEDGRVGIFDFGMVGRISPELKQHMINAFMHTIQREYRDLVDDFVGMGFLKPEADRDALCRDLTPIIDARFAEGMNKVRFRKMLFDFSEVCFAYPFSLPSEFTYVMRALLTLEGIALAINPKFNFVDAAMPFAHRLLMKNNQFLGQAIFREVFTDGKFNRSAAIKLIKSAASLTNSLR